MAVQIKNIIDREMAVLAVIRTNSSKNAYQPDESKIMADGALNSS